MDVPYELSFNYQFDNFLTCLLIFRKLSHADFINLNLKILRV